MAGRELFELLRRYFATAREAWSHRHATETIVRPAYELAFLPANLEVLETPPHPLSLWTIRILGLGTLGTILIAVFGSLDIVAVAPGQLVPVANVKVVQPAMTGVVRQIKVQNGQRVRAGELLLELDPTQVAADADRAKTAKVDAELTLVRARALLLSQESGHLPSLVPLADASDAEQENAQHLAEGTYEEYIRKIASFRAELERRRAELASTQSELSKLADTAPLARRQADDYESLAKKGYVASHEYLDKQKAAIDLARELDAQQSHARELEAAIRQQEREIQFAVATFQREQWDNINKAEREATQEGDEQTKVLVRQAQMEIRSPVAGIVQQLAVHTIGGVVTSAQTLMEVVPDDVLEVEARVTNRDIGFVDIGQEAVVKIATFPYTRFGYITGHVVKVSNDAISDKRSGLVFLARIRIPGNQFKVSRRWINLTPGMEVTAEIKTGRQKVWQYFLSPLIQTGRESLRER